MSDEEQDYVVMWRVAIPRELHSIIRRIGQELHEATRDKKVGCNVVSVWGSDRHVGFLFEWITNLLRDPEMLKRFEEYCWRKCREELAKPPKVRTVRYVLR